MRFLGLAVTLGFIFIGWRIQQSILNHLINKQRKKNELHEDRGKSKSKMKEELSDKLMKNQEPDNSSPNGGSRISYMSNYQDRFRSETQETIQIKIKAKVSKQLRVMWGILWVILFICFVEMGLSATQKIIEHECGRLTSIAIIDSSILIFSGLVGLLLWTWPLIYVYWGREYWMSWRMKKKHVEEDEEGDTIEEYYKDQSTDKITGVQTALPKLMIKRNVENSEDEDNNSMVY